LWPNLGTGAGARSDRPRRYDNRSVSRAGLWIEVCISDSPNTKRYGCAQARYIQSLHSVLLRDQFQYYLPIFGNRNSSVSIVTRLRTAHYWNPITARARGFSLPKNVLTHLSIKCVRRSLSPELMQSERVSNHSPAFIAEVKNDWRYRCTHFVPSWLWFFTFKLMAVFRGCSTRVRSRCFYYAFLPSCLALPKLEQS
jgi:hypothetical protein